MPYFIPRRLRVLAENDQLPLSDFLKKLISRLHDSVEDVAQAQPVRSAQIRALLTVAINEFEDDAQHISCENCSRDRANGAVCNGTLQDERILKSFDGLGAPCWRLVTELFDELVAIAEEHYAPMLNGAGLTVRLSTRPTPKPVVGAKAQFPPQDSATGRMTSITVDLPNESLDYTHMRSLAYTMFHEIFVHGAESWLAAGRRSTTTELCAFREGFVDAAAAAVLQEHLSECGLKSRLHQSFAEVFGRGTHVAHAQRMAFPMGGVRRGDPDAQQAATVASARNRGWKVFRSLEKRLKGKQSVQLAVCLNLLVLSEGEREALLSALDRASDGKALQTRRWQSWLEALLQAATRGQPSVAEEKVRAMTPATEF